MALERKTLQRDDFDQRFGRDAHCHHEAQTQHESDGLAVYRVPVYALSGFEFMMDFRNWEEAFRVKEQETRANPASPYNAHFYEARRGAELRIFDLYCSQTGYITIGECLPPNRAPLRPPLAPGRDFEVYSHVNYGGVKSQSPEDVMSAFAAEHGLTQVKKFEEIRTAGEMSRVLPEALRRLKVLQ